MAAGVVRSKYPAVRPPMRDAFSNTWTQNPRRASNIADARPPGPAPITTTVLVAIGIILPTLKRDVCHLFWVNLKG
jgi:hypothetical protein